MPMRLFIDKPDELSLSTQLYLHVQTQETPGDRILSLSNLPSDPGIISQHKQSVGYHISLFQSRFSCVKEPEGYHELTLGELVTSFENHGGVAANHSSSVMAICSSARSVLRLAQSSASSAPPESCPSLSSDDSGDGRDRSHMRPPLPPDCPIFASIRQVLSSDLAYAGDVISAVRQLSDDKRDLLFRCETQCVDGAHSGSPKSSAGPSKKRGRSSADDSNEGRNNEKGGDKDGGSGGGGGDGGNKGDEDGTSGGDGGSGGNKKRRKEKNRRWICPYCLAYPNILEIALFSHCWPGNMTELHLWKTHLTKHHSPRAKLEDPHGEDNAQLYMDSQQQGEVLAKIDSYKQRPRQLEDWLAYWKGLFLDVWRILFPSERFPDLVEPVSAFHLDSAEISNLGERAKILLEVIYTARAAKASRPVGTTDAAPKEAFRPTEAQINEMMSEAMAIALLSSPGAAGAAQWLAHASPQTLQTAVASHGETPESQAGTCTVAPQGEVAGANEHALAAPSDIPIPPKTPEFDFADLDAEQAVPLTFPTASLALFSYGTQVVINLSPTHMNALQTGVEMGQLNLTLPASFYMADITQTRIAPPFMASAMAIPEATAHVAQSNVHLTQGNAWQPSVSQDIPTLTNQGKPSSQEVLAVKDALEPRLSEV